jgi:hypothetical protein
VQKLIRKGYDDVGIFVEMADDMPAFKRLLDAGQAIMDALCERFPGFYYYSVKSGILYDICGKSNRLHRIEGENRHLHSTRYNFQRLSRAACVSATNVTE